MKFLVENTAFPSPVTHYSSWRHKPSQSPSTLRNKQCKAPEVHLLHLGLVLSLDKGNVKAGEAELSHTLVVTHGYFGIVKATVG